MYHFRSRFAIVGVPEDIGVRANLGRAGARDGWAAFLPAFAAMQSNATLRGEGVVLLGHVEVGDLMERAESEGWGFQNLGRVFVSFTTCS